MKVLIYVQTGYILNTVCPKGQGKIYLLITQARKHSITLKVQGRHTASWLVAGSVRLSLRLGYYQPTHSKPRESRNRA